MSCDVTLTLQAPAPTLVQLKEWDWTSDLAKVVYDGLPTLTQLKVGVAVSGVLTDDLLGMCVYVCVCMCTCGPRILPCTRDVYTCVC